MDDKQQYQNKKRVNGYAAITGGVVLFVLGYVLGNVAALSSYLRLLQGIGVFLVLWGVFLVVQAVLYKKNPSAMRKDLVENRDERRLLIRYRSGNNAFLFAIAASYVTLLVVGMTESPINPDTAWWVLAAIVSITLVVYVGSLAYYENKF